jgi:hypothetical protein
MKNTGIFNSLKMLGAPKKNGSHNCILLLSEPLDSIIFGNAGPGSVYNNYESVTLIVGEEPVTIVF